MKSSAIGAGAALVAAAIGFGVFDVATANGEGVLVETWNAKTLQVNPRMTVNALPDGGCSIEACATITSDKGRTIGGCHSSPISPKGCAAVAERAKWNGLVAVGMADGGN